LLADPASWDSLIAAMAFDGNLATIKGAVPSISKCKVAMRGGVIAIVFASLEIGVLVITFMMLDPLQKGLAHSKPLAG